MWLVSVACLTAVYTVSGGKSKTKTIEKKEHQDHQNSKLSGQFVIGWSESVREVCGQLRTATEQIRKEPANLRTP